MARTTPGLLLRQQADGAEERFPLQQAVTTIGRGSSCTLVINVPMVSRLHARIELENERYILADAGSANGTFVNGRRIERPHPLRTGDEIWLGSKNVILRFADPAEQTATPPNQQLPAHPLPEHPRARGTGDAPTAESQRPDDMRPSPLRESSTTGIIKAMTSTSIHKHPAAFFNTRLPILDTALNIAEMTQHLGPLLRSLAGAGDSPRVTYARLLTFKQGNRGLIQYQVAGTESGEHGVVFGKLYPEPGLAARMYRTMQGLWSDVFSGAGQVGVPQPLGYVAGLAMLVYIPAQGQFLDAAMADERAVQRMDRAGAWLARLHRSAIPLEKQFQLDTELVNIQVWAALIGHKCPEEAGVAAQLARRLQEGAAPLQLELRTPIHGDFHPRHIIVNDRLTVVDLDALRGGDPNFDLAHFCAYLRLLAHRQQIAPDHFAALQSAFLDGYARRQGWVANERFAYFYAYTCLKIAKHLCSTRGPHSQPEGVELRRQIQYILQHGLAAGSRAA